MDKDFSRSEVVKLFDNKNNIIGAGAFGTVRVYDPLTVIKTYHGDVYKLSPCLIPASFDKRHAEEVYRKSRYPNIQLREDLIKLAKSRLEATKYTNDLIKGIAYYNEYAFGTFLTYYKSYIELYDLSKKLKQSDKLILFDNLDKTLKDLYDNYIYPLDIKESNVMVNPKTLDVKLIDLDDRCSYYMDSYDEAKLTSSYGHFETLKKRVLSKK